MSTIQDNRFYREAEGVPHSGPNGSYRGEVNKIADFDNGYRSAVRLARVLMDKHHPGATGWEPAPDLLGVMTQIDHLTTGLVRPEHLRNAAAQVCRHVREIVGATTGSSIAMALAEAEDRIRALPLPPHPEKQEGGDNTPDCSNSGEG